MYAVIATGGKQERVEVGSRIEVELLSGDVDTEVQFTPVLLVDDESIVADADALAEANVSGRILGESKGPKINGFTYKSKSRSRRRFGHRQHYTVVEITNISATRPAARRPRTAAAAS